MEIYKEVKGFEGLYEISTYGNLKSIGRFVNSSIKNQIKVFRKPKLIKPSLDKYGYHKVVLRKDGKKFNRTIHQLVALAFIKNTNNYKSINHKDTIKINNNYLNLEWCTPGMNNAHGVVNHLFASGEKNANTILTTNQVKEIRELRSKGLSSYKIYKLFPFVSYTTIKNIINGKTWKYE